MNNITTITRGFSLEFGEKSNITSHLFLIDNPRTIGFIFITYILFILKIGPNYMKNRPAYKLTNLVLVYNIFQVLASIYIVVKGGSLLLKFGLLPRCDLSDDLNMDCVTVVHHYFLIKITELLDTVFFVLRKKNNQTTFLHIYHHSYMFTSVWATLRYDPSYATLFPGALNSFIHIIMYTYYSLSVFPKLAKYLWWKKYITSMQLIQFFIIISHMVRCYHVADCPPSFYLAYSMVANVFLFVILFSNFYLKTYSKKTSSQASVYENGKVKEKVT